MPSAAALEVEYDAGEGARRDRCRGNKLAGRLVPPRRRRLPPQQSMELHLCAVRLAHLHERHADGAGQTTTVKTNVFEIFARASR